MIFSVLSVSLISCKSASDEKKVEQHEEKVQYQCPMDCEKGKTYNEPGQCPVCGMDLEKAPVKL